MQRGKHAMRPLSLSCHGFAAPELHQKHNIKVGALPWLSSMSAGVIHQFVRTTILIWPQQDDRRGKWRVVLHNKHFARQNDSINVFQFDFNTVKKFLILISIVEWSTISPLNVHKSARTLLMKWVGTQGMIPALQSWLCCSWITPEAGLGGGAQTWGWLGVGGDGREQCLVLNCSSGRRGQGVCFCNYAIANGCLQLCGTSLVTARFHSKVETKSSAVSFTWDIVIKILLGRLDQRESSPNQFPLPVNTLGSLI